MGTLYIDAHKAQNYVEEVCLNVSSPVGMVPKSGKPSNAALPNPPDPFILTQSPSSNTLATSAVLNGAFLSLRLVSSQQHPQMELSWTKKPPQQRPLCRVAFEDVTALNVNCSCVKSAEMF